jgi:hypothetical protein
MSETIDTLRRDNANLTRQLEVALQKLSIYEDEDLEKEGYFALKAMVKQQIDIIKEFKIKDEISKSPKDDKYYDRVKALSEGLKSMITDLKTLKMELKISPDEERESEVKRKRAITAESVADEVGELAGKK